MRSREAERPSARDSAQGGLAYRILGSAAEAEDVVQEALTRVDRTGEVRSPRALLTTIVTRLCVDERRS